jgi:hypothetical protein
MIANIVIVAVVALVLAAVIMRAVRNKRTGKNASCGCGCDTDSCAACAAADDAKNS